MKSNNDVSPFIAIALLLLVTLGLFGLHKYEFVINNWDYIRSAIYKTQDALLLFTLSIFINIYIISMIAERSLGYKKQGSKLRSIKNEKINYKNLALKSLFSIVGVAFFYEQILTYIEINTLPFKSILGGIYPSFVKTILMSSSFSYCLLLFWVIGALGFLSNLFQGHRLPSLKEVENHLTLGTVGEEENNFEKKVNPKWALIPQKALNGNILVTGSIGTGKTQGTILNFAEQLFGNNFHLTPSSLVLDPKGSFIPEVVNILKKRGALNDCVYLGDAHGNI